MGRLFVRGDTHGNFDFLPYFCEEYNTTYSDVLVILGDAGILYYGPKSKKEKELKEWLSTFPITLFCVRGNHERRPEESDVPTIHSDLVAGDVYQQPEYPNILYALDGGEYRFNGNSILTIGGAYSVDKDYRRIMNYYWNPREQLDTNERALILSNACEKHYDFIFAHTCPYTAIPKELFLSGIDQSKVDNSMEFWFDELISKCSFNAFLCGHFHDDMVLMPYIEMYYNRIEEANTILDRWENYKNTKILPTSLKKSKKFLLLEGGDFVYG